VNFEPPWNPTRLEQRVGRVHRFGQTQPVQVIHLLTENSIEERVWETLRLKKALFTGLFVEAKDEISFDQLGRKSMMHVIKDVFSDQPGRPTSVLTPEAPQPVAVMAAKRNGKAAAKNGHTGSTTSGIDSVDWEVFCKNPFCSDLQREKMISPAPLSSNIFSEQQEFTKMLLARGPAHVN